MGQMFIFVNKTTEQQSEIPLPFNFGLTWAKSLEKFSDEELKEAFDFVIRENNWNEADKIIALGEYGILISRSNA